MASGDASLLSPQWSGTPVAAIVSDAAILARFVSIERAWLEGLGAHGVEVAQATAGLKSLVLDAEKVHTIAQGAGAAGNPVVGFVEYVRSHLGDQSQAAEVFHRGLTSHDVLDTAMMMTASDVREVLREDLVAVAKSLVVLAEKYSHTECVTRTLSRNAEVSVLGFRFASWAQGVLDALTVIDSLAGLPIQVGGAVGNRAAIGAIAHDLDVDELIASVAQKLGLASPPTAWHSNRIPVLQVTHGFAAAAAALGVIAHNVVALGRPEVGELLERVADGRGGSSAMPHKKNPTLSILSHSVSQRIPGIVAQIHAASTPVAERGEGQWNAEWEPFRDLMLLVGGQAHHVRILVETLDVDEEAVAGNLARSGIPDVVLTSRAQEQMQRDISRVAQALVSQTKGSDQ